MYRLVRCTNTRTICVYFNHGVSVTCVNILWCARTDAFVVSMAFPIPCLVSIEIALLYIRLLEIK